jgi:tetratricopeptide (TPR) repeat protein
MPMQPRKDRLAAPRQETARGCRLVAILCAALVWFAMGANIAKSQGNEDTMAAHYAAAQNAQSAKDFPRAVVEYKTFLSDALRRLASRRAASGDLKGATSILEEALDLTPNDTKLRLDFAKACRSAGDLSKARAAAENVLILEPRSAKAHLELGAILLRMGDEQAATLQLEVAVGIEPNFENGYALAKAYLKQKDPVRASKVFAEMQAGLGDSPELHMEFGSAYAELGYPERGIPEFEKALEENDHIHGGHYSLGAARLAGLGNAMQDSARAEFLKELQNYPDDPLSLYQLGNIEFERHQFEAAERHLLQAEKLDGKNPDAYLTLGQIYNETGRRAEAEMALRRSIALTTDVARNNYQAQRAHYLLARLLLQSGQDQEAKLEMKTANDLLKRSTAATQGLTGQSNAPAQGTMNVAAPLDAEKMKQAKDFEEKIRAAVADSYNNLGAMAASEQDFRTALHSFEEAAKWNPSLEGLDYNWGRAAFSSGEYGQAVEPLARYLREHQDDTWVRSALGSSYFSLHKYPEAMKTLRPMEQSLDGSPQLSYIYAVSQVKGGEYTAGVSRLQALENANPNVALIREALADVYANAGEPEKAAREKEVANAIKERQVSTSPPQVPNHP